jgi:hypothetical protein
MGRMLGGCLTILVQGVVQAPQLRHELVPMTPPLNDDITHLISFGVLNRTLTSAARLALADNKKRPPPVTVAKLLSTLLSFAKSTLPFST